MLNFDLGNDNAVWLHLAKDHMKRMTRLSIEVRRREVTITVQGSTLHVQDVDPGSAKVPPTCPACGSPSIVVLTRTAGDVLVGVDQIYHGLQQAGLHVQVSPAGLLRICQRSFEELKEKL